MSAVQPPASTETDERLLVENTRMGMDARLVLLVVGIGFLHALIGLTWSDFLGHSPAAVLILSILTIFSAAGVFLRSTSDRFEMFRALSVFFLLAFGLAPLLFADNSLWFYETPKSVLMVRSAALALLAYLCIAAGYFVPIYRSAPAKIPLRSNDLDPRRAVPIGLALFVLGVFGFVVLFIQAGGFSVIVSGEGDLARNEFFVGIGWFFWVAMFMVPGGAIYFAAMAAIKGRSGWIHCWPLVTAFLLLITLQGRHRALGPLIISLVISNFLVRRIQLRRLAIYGLVGLTLSVLVGIVRSPSLRPIFAADPAGVTLQILQDYPDHVRSLLVVDISRLAEVMIVVDKIPERIGYFGGVSFFQIANPLLRLVNLHHLQPKNVGFHLYPLARPEIFSEVRTGFLPSMVGEFRANFPWYLCAIAFFLFGMLLRLNYQAFIVKRGDFLAVAAYATFGLFLCNAVIGTFNQNAFEELLLLGPVIAARMLVRKARPHYQQSQGDPMRTRPLSGTR